jgi:hypothetical protein
MVSYSKRLTFHARVRAQQRSIPVSVISLLEEFGSMKRVYSRADAFIFDKAARRRLERKLGKEGLKGIQPYRSVYIVVSDDGQVVTVARRLKRMHW